jgi:hypothetical protein
MLGSMVYVASLEKTNEGHGCSHKNLNLLFRDITDTAGKQTAKI